MSSWRRLFVFVVLGTFLFSVQLIGAEQTGRGPVVFIHGLCSDSETWATTKDVMQDKGWTFGGTMKDPMDLFEVNLHPANADFYLLNFADQSLQNGIESWASELQLYLQRIDQFRTQHGVPSSKFTVIGHSAGGLVARYYLQKRYRGNINHLITYGTPHLGTETVMFRRLVDYFLTFFPVYYVSDSLCWNPVAMEESLGVTEMVPNSTFLTDLNSQPFPTDVQYTALVGDFSVSSGCLDSDCIVSTASQNMQRLPKPPRADLIAVRTVVNRDHTTQTSDANNILWALNRLIPVPSAPRNLVASPGATTVSLAWNPPTTGTVSSYLIEVGSSSSITDITTFDTGNTATQYNISAMTARTYFMRVRAKNQSGVGPVSNEVSFTIGTATPTPTSNRFVGNWINLDVLARLFGGITRVSIRSQGNGFLANIWSACGFSECAEGETSAVSGPNGTLVATWNFPGVVQTATFSLTATGYLSVVVHVHHSNGSGDYYVTATLLKTSS